MAFDFKLLSIYILSTYYVPGTGNNLGIIEFCSKKVGLTTRHFQQDEAFLKFLYNGSCGSKWSSGEAIVVLCYFYFKSMPLFLLHLTLPDEKTGSQIIG